LLIRIVRGAGSSGSIDPIEGDSGGRGIVRARITVGGRVDVEDRQGGKGRIEYLYSTKGSLYYVASLVWSIISPAKVYSPGVISGHQAQFKAGGCRRATGRWLRRDETPLAGRGAPVRAKHGGREQRHADRQG